MTKQEIKELAEELYALLTGLNEENPNEERFIMEYESEDGLLIDHVLQEIVGLKDQIREYEERNEFKLAAACLSKIKRLETKLKELTEK